MLKQTHTFPDFVLKQFQFGSFSISLSEYLNDESLRNSRVLLAVNIFVIEKENEIFILDSGYDSTLNIPSFKANLKYSFSEIINVYRTYHHVTIILSHAHPDHIGGLIAYFPEIKKLNWRICINRRALQTRYYKYYPIVQDFLENHLINYQNYLDSNNLSSISLLYIGGHTPEHSVIHFKDSNIYYMADLIPTAYHLKHNPLGEKNYNNDDYTQLKSLAIDELSKKKALLLLPHAPNDGFFQL